MTLTQSNVVVSAIITAAVTIGSGGVAPATQNSTSGTETNVAVSGGSTYTANGGTGLAATAAAALL